MPKYIIKVDRNLDLYMEWSSIVDHWTFIGNREEMLAEGATEARLDRADKYGTTQLHGAGNWYDKGKVITNSEFFDGFRWLPRENFADFAMGIYSGEEEAKVTLLYTEEIKDDE